MIYINIHLSSVTACHHSTAIWGNTFIIGGFRNGIILADTEVIRHSEKCPHLTITPMHNREGGLECALLPIVFSW